MTKKKDSDDGGPLSRETPLAHSSYGSLGKAQGSVFPEFSKSSQKNIFSDAQLSSLEKAADGLQKNSLKKSLSNPFSKLEENVQSMSSIFDEIQKKKNHEIKSVEDVGVKIREIRKEMGLTQQQFADLAGVGRRFISELENGKETLEFGKILKACDAAGLDITARGR